MNGSAPARLSASFLFTRVPPGPAAPEGAQVMRQFPPRPCPDRWPGTVLDREQQEVIERAGFAGELRRNEISADVEAAPA